jgi:acetyl-CoA C-acetyltransferase
MTFAGGPFNNYVFQSTAAMAERLRGDRGARGLVTTVSGLLTKPGLAVWSATPPEQPLLVRDLADEAAGDAGAVDGVTGYEGAATVASATVTYDGQRPVRVVVIADTPAGTRAVAVADDPELAARAIAEDLIGTTIRVRGTSFTT